MFFPIFTATPSTLYKRLVDELYEAELIIHAGDVTGKHPIDDLRRLGPLRGVYGNIDSLVQSRQCKRKSFLQQKGPTES